MRSKLLQENGERTYVLVFDKGDEVIAGLKGFATFYRLRGSYFSAIGAFSDVVLQFFDHHSMSYRDIPVNQQVEVLSLLGNITFDDDEAKIHAHAVVGLSDGTTRGGHLSKAHVWPTLEVVISETPKSLRRKTDPETGLALIDLKGANLVRT